MKRQIARAAVVAALVLVGVALLAGAIASDSIPGRERLDGEATAPAPKQPVRYPLAPGPTAEEIQLVVFERAYSECASSDLELLAAKYKAAGRSSRAVAAIVARAWASYFSAGADAVEDGRAGCLQGLRDRGS